MKKNDYKRLIPNILTISRIVITPFIIILGILGQINIVIVLVIIAAITDLIDGNLARYWNVTSLKGAKLDTIADKIFAIGITASLITRYQIFIIPLILEIILGLLNLYFHFKTNKTESLNIGKIKTWILFTTLIIGILATFTNSFNKILTGFAFTTINLQVLCFIFYSVNFCHNITKKKISIEDEPMHKKIMQNIDNNNYEKTLVLDEIKSLNNKIFDYDKY
ncbi:MAG: CDP-alcohol phosphatidyltransferase family protein [Bacilli bacterium]